MNLLTFVVGLTTKLIPILRSKFDAIVTFREEVGAGSNIDYEGMGDSFSDGSETVDEGSGGIQMSGCEFPAGMTIYGRWTSVSVQTTGQKCVCYVG